MINKSNFNKFLIVAAVLPSVLVAQDCHPSYVGVCLPVDAVDVDCSQGSGDGPVYAVGPFRVVGPDVYDLDRDNDGIGCEKG